MNDKKITRKLMKEASTAINGIIKHAQTQQDMALREIRIHMLDEDGDGIGFWIEYNEVTGEFEKGIIPISADMMEDMHENSEHDDTLGHKNLLN